MNEVQTQTEVVKAWLLPRVGKIIKISIFQRSHDEKPGEILWEGQGRVIRCTKPGVVLELEMGQPRSYFGRLFQAFRNLVLKHVVRPWDQKRLSVPYADLFLETHPESGEVRLMIDAATWKRSLQELQREN